MGRRRQEDQLLFVAEKPAELALWNLRGGRKDRYQPDPGATGDRRCAGSADQGGEAGAGGRFAAGPLGCLSSGGFRDRVDEEESPAAGEPRAWDLLVLQQLGF